MELVNPDTSWRRLLYQGGWRGKLQLAQALFAYPVRPSAAVASIFKEDIEAFERWSTLTSSRRVVGLAGADAHAKLALTDAESGDNRFALPFPGYRSMFESLSTSTRLKEKLSGDAARDAALVWEALRAGRAHVVVDGIATPGALEFSAANGTRGAGEGEILPVSGTTIFRVRSNAPAGFAIRLWKGAQLLAEHVGSEMSTEVPDATGSFRVTVEASLNAHRRTWIVSNPIYVSMNQDEASPATDASERRQTLFDGRSTQNWRSETDGTSRGEVDVVGTPGDGELRLRYALREGAPSNQFAALVAETPSGVAAGDRLSFRVRADRPTRVSVQVRVAVTKDRDDRWQRSVYVDAVPRTYSVAFDDMRPVGVTSVARPALEHVHTVVFAVDMTHSRPGWMGEVLLKNVELRR
jgi:hypothetical protein